MTMRTDDPRKKKITPVLPTRVTSTGLVEDSINADNRGLYKNLAKEDEYWTYDEKTKEIVVMEIPKDPKKPTKILRTIKDMTLDKWKEVRSTMEVIFVDDKKDDESGNTNIVTESKKLIEDYKENGVTMDHSDIYTGRYGHRFFYNYDMNRLEHVDGTYTVGISRPDWEDNPTYWVSAADKEVEMDSVYS